VLVVAVLAVADDLPGGDLDDRRELRRDQQHATGDGHGKHGR